MEAYRMYRVCVKNWSIFAWSFYCMFWDFVLSHSQRSESHIIHTQIEVHLLRPARRLLLCQWKRRYSQFLTGFCSIFSGILLTAYHPFSRSKWWRIKRSKRLCICRKIKYITSAFVLGEKNHAGIWYRVYLCVLLDGLATVFSYV